MIDFDAQHYLGADLPVDITAEEAVLGWAMLDDNCYKKIEKVIKGGDFSCLKNRLVYEGIKQVYTNEGTINLVSLQDHLLQGGKLKLAGGITYLVELQENVNCLSEVDEACNRVKAKAQLRELITCAAAIISNCYTQDEEMGPYKYKENEA